tara:strand:- start:2402 stop:3616 length:1215 start_codon:yes stop_codon:yes gene_type:complete
MTEPGWGLLPEQVIARLKAREWDNRRRLKARLSGVEPFPISVPLKPPQGQAALVDLQHFQRFISAWRAYPHSAQVRWRDLSYRSLAQQRVPTHLLVVDIAELAAVLGPDEQQALQRWQSRIGLILGQPFAQGAQLQGDLFTLLIAHLETLDSFTELDLQLLLSLIPQLRQGMGGGDFLRALPVTFVDTKFVEQNLRLIEQLANLLHGGAVLAAGGLLAWLGSRSNPKGWLWVRPLCERSQQAMGGLPLLQLATDTLLSYELPAQHLLVVENVQSGLALPALDDTIAVFGGGKNLAWLTAGWLANKQVGYWGDIDSEGFCMLADARHKLPALAALMMDERTLLKYQQRMVDEPQSVLTEPQALKLDELRLFRDLRSGRYGHARLEQERIAPEYVLEVLQSWRSGC